MKHVSFFVVYNIGGKQVFFMTIFELMDSRSSSFSKTDREIFERIRKNPEKIAFESITRIAESGGFTKSALTRFAQKLGFAGFTEFQFQFQQDLKTKKDTDETRSLAQLYSSVLTRTEETTDRSVLEALCRKLKESRHVYLFGSNLARLPAEYLLIQIQNCRDVSAFMPQMDLLPLNFTPEDTIIIFSAISGRSYQSFMQRLRKDEGHKPYMVLITTNAKHPLRHNFNEIHVLPTTGMDDSPRAVMADTLSFMMFADLLGNSLQEYNREETE